MDGEALQSISQSEGYIVPTVIAGEGSKKSVKGFDTNNGQTTYSKYAYVFQYKDHLGNVRLSYSDKNLDGAIQTEGDASEIIEESNYYPFGLLQKGYNRDVNGGNSLAQAFKFGGKEYQEELDLNWYDVTARNYDPALGRWMNLDPLAEDMRRHSPYSFAFNNPIYFQDYDGMAPTGAEWIDNGDGSYTAEKNDSASTLHSQHLEDKGYTFEETDAIVEGQYGENRVEGGVEKSNIDKDDVVEVQGEMDVIDFVEATDSALYDNIDKNNNLIEGLDSEITDQKDRLRGRVEGTKALESTEFLDPERVTTGGGGEKAGVAQLSTIRQHKTNALINDISKLNNKVDSLKNVNVQNFQKITNKRKIKF